MRNINIYSDESCHIENDGYKYMIIGALWCDKDNAPIVSQKIKSIKQKYNIPLYQEVKWSKISPAKTDMYCELVNCFFNTEDLNFRVVVVNKENLDHIAFNQTYSQFYYKMYWILLKNIFDNNINSKFNIFFDPKDTHTFKDVAVLSEISNLRTNGSVPLLEPTDSSRNHMMQLADILIGCVKFLHNKNCTSKSKNQVFRVFEKEVHDNLFKNSPLYEKKVNIFHWNPSHKEDIDV